LAQLCADLLGGLPREVIGGAAGGERADQPERFDRLGLRKSAAGAECTRDDGEPQIHSIFNASVLITLENRATLSLMMAANCSGVELTGIMP
jgi:hypothetical protein